MKKWWTPRRIEALELALHAKKLGFVHPRTGEYMEFESELPEYFTKFLKSIEG